MDILLVNPAHPRIAHVSAVRAWQFACELARRGHRVVLLSAAGESTECERGEHLQAHDWSRPYVLTPEVWEQFPADHAGSAALRKASTALRLVMSGGHQHRWVAGAVAAMVALRDRFCPEAIWATYGKMEAAIAAKRIARALGKPWVLDLKDSWELFVPGVLRRIMAWRIRGWTAMTANSEFNRELARVWHGADATVVYSGIDAAFFDAPGDPDPSTFDLVLVGGLYSVGRLEALLAGLGTWVATLPAQEAMRVRLTYLGNDQARFEQATVPLHGCLAIRNPGFVPVGEMAALCRNAAMNLYIAFDMFHHKLLELLASGRPLLAFPLETEESRRLARDVGGDLIEPADAAGVARALDAAYHAWRSGAGLPVRPPSRTYSWQAQTRLLEEVLRRATTHAT